jgi:hypothetical protein
VGVQRVPDDAPAARLFIDLPTGQIAWSIPQAELVGRFRAYNKMRDQRSESDRRGRIADYVRGV